MSEVCEGNVTLTLEDVQSGLGYLEKWWRYILTPGSLSDSSLTNGTVPYSASS